MAILWAIALAISTPLPGHVTYACAGNSDMLRSQWAVWAAVAEGRCQVFLDQ
jgi:hypothetical protein